ncbi:MAG: lysoplasmalogenase [bacterium]|nr:lysoplasmalogenase [bacterium]
MNATAVIFLVLTAVSALIHWWSVATTRRPVLLVTKPLTMLLLIRVALSIDTAATSTRAWFILALVLSLAGDVFLMLEPDQFIAGLASFLAAHVAYVVGLVLAGFSLAPAIVALGAALIAFAVLGKRILNGANTQDSRLQLPVALYMTVISAMVVSAAATTNAIATAGAALFYGSDATLGWNRFVSPIANGRLITMITYHAGQTLLILALVTL